MIVLLYINLKSEKLYFNLRQTTRYWSKDFYAFA